MKELLQLREERKAKKPVFIRQLGTSMPALGKKWRAPKGMHSKLRKKFRGKRKMPSIGYSSPSKVKGLHPSGLKQVLIHTVADLSYLKENVGIIIASTVGKKKKIEIIKKAKELKIKILHIKDLDKYVKDVEESVKQKKVVAKEREEKKKKSKEETEKKAKEKEKEKQEPTPEEKEKEEKEEKRKVLESKR